MSLHIDSEVQSVDGKTLHDAVAFARGIDGLMYPAPGLADSEHAIALLRFQALVGVA